MANNEGGYEPFGYDSADDEAPWAAGATQLQRATQLEGGATQVEGGTQLNGTQLNGTQLNGTKLDRAAHTNE